ncbi:MAG: uracil-DNA glycosylase family protein [Chloroflexota bacterium]
MFSDALSDAICACERCFCQGLLPPMPDYRARNRRYLRRFLPAKLELLFIAESPPISGCYFYRLPEWSQRGVYSALFWETARALGIAPAGPRRYECKEEYLLAFAARGLAILDIARCPVNKISDARANQVFANCAPFLREELAQLRPARLVLIKKTNRILPPWLREWGWESRLLSDEPLAFPVAGNQGRFRAELAELARRHPDIANLLGS